jgi:hypothetical protein
MRPETLFQLSSSLAMIGWLILIIVSPFWWGFDKLLVGIVIALLALVYAWLIINSFKPGNFSDFGSLEGVMRLFQNKTLVTAGWVHYLAFDLLTGVWIKKNAIKHNIHHAIIIPVLLLTFMLGPIGFLLYLLIRWARTKRYFSEN